MHDKPEVIGQELDRQRRLMRRELPERLLLASLAFGLCMIWANPLVVALLWLAYLLLVGLLVSKYDAALARPGTWQYGATLAGIALGSALYASAAGLVWQVDSPFSKALAAIVVMAGLMHLSTVRSIHLPIGIAGLVGMSVATLAANAIYWLRLGDFAALGLSTAGCFAAIAYALTAMLSNHQLHRSMAAGARAAQAAENAKSRFLSRMSHELRTPLNAIVGMALEELAATEASPSADKESSLRRQRMQSLGDAARALALILDDVSDLDAISSGRLTLRPRSLHLKQELLAIADVHSARAARLGIPLQVTLETATMPEFVKLDPLRLRQCLGNLLANAFLHAPQGEVRLTASCLPDEARPGAEGLLQLDVCDSGPGIPRDQRETIFEAFRRGRDDGSGSGLGLAIASELARSMDGDLILLPTTRGAAFRLTLHFEVTGPPVPASGPPDLTGRSVLVVDDVATNRLVAASYLKAMGARVIGAASGPDALTILASEDIALVLLDMNMPGMDGYATAAHARALGQKVSAVPIVAMTADVMEDQIQAIRQAGFDGYLPKPLLPEALEAELARLLT